ncbi:sensor histidine kinase [Mucilaginibacter segetis]|uniref:histidine kinase n=1 Tax=Mucilaginibacter segetis TaxID=2793071 RepID=A0A934PU90_9SPHI|nr:histidine kinase [Mucilaginibacter segetis]MBK0379123.1 hypothetical protein [Mucilaginibacter segetis]
MQNKNDNIYILIILGIAGTFLLVVSFILYSIRNQNKLLKQRQKFQQAEIAHQKELLRAVIESQEAERKRIGQDLHDDVGTMLSGLRLIIEMFKPKDENDVHHVEFIKSSKNTIDKIVKDVRNISHNLSPTTLAYYGLVAAITEHCTIINQSGKLDIAILNNADNELGNLDSHTATAIYRVLEELLNNTIKHSGASNANIKFFSDEQYLKIIYTDNGRGLSQQVTSKKGMGMQNIESRLLNINADFKLGNYNDKGFSITINYPVV